MSDFWEQYKHPLWQKKRLEILEREHFTCEMCGSDDDPLHIHHVYYERGLKPWEYPDNCYRCLCKDCHDFCQERRRRFNRLLAEHGEDELCRFIGDLLSYGHVMGHLPDGYTIEFYSCAEARSFAWETQLYLNTEFENIQHDAVVDWFAEYVDQQPNMRVDASKTGYYQFVEWCREHEFGNNYFNKVANA